MLRDETRKKIVEELTVKSHAPSHVIIDMAWMWSLEKIYPWFFMRYRINELIAKAIAIPYDRDYDDIVWTDIESKFTDNEIEELNSDKLDLDIESISEEFYKRLSKEVDIEHYEWVFEKWVDKNSMMLRRTETTI